MYVSVHAMHFLNFYVLVCKHALFKHSEEKQHLWYVESRQKINSGLGGFLVGFFLGGGGEVFGFFFRKHIGRHSKSQSTSGNGRPKHYNSQMFS